MAWTTLEFSKSEINKAGQQLLKLDCISSEERGHVIDVVNNWRAAHTFPLNTLQIGLRTKAREVEATPLIAQRVKRLSSITLKLERFPSMQLSRMQDIGGCRAVMLSVENVRAAVARLKGSRMRHQLVSEDDYITQPKASGYRGVHLIYRYLSEKNEIHNGRNIEVQVRSQKQHAWATAVETAGTFLRQALKSSQGEQDWLRFFALMGTAIARQENSNSVPATPMSDVELRKEIRSYSKELDVVNHLYAYASAIEHVNQKKNAKYFILELYPSKKELNVTGFRADELESASIFYAQREAVLEKDGDVVLVSSDSISSLRRAYPNYFLDNRIFIDCMNDYLSV